MNTDLKKIQSMPDSGTQTPPLMDPNFNGTPVTLGQGEPSITASMLDELNAGQPLLTRKSANVETVSTEATVGAGLAEAAETLKKLARDIEVSFSVATSKSKVLDERDSNLTLREEALRKEISTFKEEQSKALNEAMKDGSAKRKEPLFLITKDIQSRMPGLLKAYESVCATNTPEAKAKFVSLYLSEIASAFNNITACQQEQVNVSELKTSVSKSIPLLDVFKGADKNKAVLEFIQLALAEIKDPSTPTPPASKAALIKAGLYKLFESLKCFLTLTAAYTIGKLEPFLLATLLPEAVSNLILAIQEYAGAPTVPLLCFGIALLAKLLIQAGSKVKESKWPTSPEAQLKAQHEEIKKLFAKQALLIAV